jgi:hypothetical protein
MAKLDNIGKKEFSTLVKDLKYKPHQSIINRLDKRFFSLDQNKVYNYKPAYLASSEYKRCLELFEKRFGASTSPLEGAMLIEGLWYQISQMEAPIADQLINIAVEIIKEIYNVPDHVDLKASLSPRIHLDTDENQDDDPEAYLELTREEKNEMQDEIQKRIILNGLVHGSSMHIWKGIHHLVADKINQLNPVLMEMYDQYTAVIGIGLWIQSIDMMQAATENNAHVTKGFNEIKFKEPGKPQATVLCNAVNFPVLLHELNKGVVDYLICRGIPAYDERKLKYYYAKADSYQNEIWHYILSPTLWVDLISTADVDNHKLPGLIAGLTKLSYQELTELFRVMIDDKEKAKLKMQVWKLI